MRAGISLPSSRLVLPVALPEHPLLITGKGEAKMERLHRNRWYAAMSGVGGGQGGILIVREERMHCEISWWSEDAV